MRYLRMQDLLKTSKNVFRWYFYSEYRDKAVDFDLLHIEKNNMHC